MPDTLAIALDRNVPVPLRDGVATRADVWRLADGAPHPAILIRTPYRKESLGAQSPVDPRRAAERGYALVVQDVRGKGASEGTFEPFVQERPDGFDSVEWVAGQPWCDGRVVMLGASYVGATQWLAASTRPPGLKAIAPLISTDGYGEGWSFRSGVLEAGFLGTWIAGSLAPDELLWLDDLERSFGDRDGLAALAPWIGDWYAEPVDAEYWASRSVTREREAIDVPILHVAGWYDCFLAGTLRSFATPRRAADRLIVGPWAHDSDYSHLVGERHLGIAGAGDVFGLGERVLDFYDAALAGEQPSTPPVTAYLLGARRWEGFDAWPPPAAVPVNAPLAGGGSFDVDPADVPRSLGGRALLVSLPLQGMGARDQRPTADRDDVLALPVDGVPPGTVLAGPVRAHLRTRAEGGETRDWAVTLCVEHADGALVNLAEGVARRPVGDDHVVVDVGDVFVQLQPGERLVLLVAGGSFPRWEAPAAPGRQDVLLGSELELLTLS